MSINLGQLRVFEAVTRAGSFTQAADRLHVTPPAVSLQIRLLEQAYGVRLFDRVRRRVRLTPAGQRLEQYAQRIFALVDDAERALQESRDFTGGQLRIVASGTSAAYYLPPILTRFRRRYPGVRVHLDVGNSQRVRERIASLEEDVGMLGVETPHPDLVFQRLAEDPLVVIVSPRHSWARRRHVSLADLRQERLILREPGSGSRQLIDSRLATLGERIRPAMEVASNEVIKRVVEMGNGVGLMSRAVVQREIEGGHLHPLGIRGERLARPIHLVYHRERRDSPLIHAVLKAARARRVPANTRPSPEP